MKISRFTDSQIMALLKQNEAGASPLITTAEAKKRHQMMSFSKNVWSGRQDLNLRPPAPQAGALPNCATPRFTLDAVQLEPQERRYITRIVAVLEVS
jgi:hypothetical protein